MSDEDRRLPPEVRDRLRRAGGAQPDEALRARTIEALRKEGLIEEPTRTGRQGRREIALAAAVVVAAVFLAGVWAGSLGRGPAIADAPSAADGLYLLLLHEPVGGLAVDGRTERQLTSEYAAWARSEAGAGRLVRGEKLAAEKRWASGGLLPERAAPTEISGFFLIRAPDLRQATAIAESCPHVRYGGAIELRPIVSTG